MMNIRNAVAVSFFKNELKTFSDEDILSLDVNEGLSIPFVARLSFITERRLTKKELNSYLNQTVEITVKQSKADFSVSRQRTLHGMVSALLDKGRYQQGIENSQRKDYFSYELTVVPEIVKLSATQKTRSFSQVKIENLISDIFSEYGLTVVTFDNDLWEKSLLTDNLILSQSNESDLEFIQRLSRAFGLNYSIVYDRENRRNKYIFSRGFVTDRGAKVFQNSSSMSSDLTGKTLQAQLYSQNLSFFDGHCIDDIVSSITADIDPDKKAELSLADSFLSKGVITSKSKQDLKSYYLESESCLFKSLKEKVLVKTSDLSFVPGEKFTVKDYSDDDEYLVIRSALLVNAKISQAKNTEYSLKENCFALKVVRNSEEHRILGCVTDIQRVNENSTLKDAWLVQKNNDGAAVFSKTAGSAPVTGILPQPNRLYNASESSFTFVHGYVCDSEGRYTDYKETVDEEEQIVSIAGSAFPFTEKNSIPTKFYLKTGDSDTPLTVLYINQTGNPADYLSFFPRVGQRAVALKNGSRYYFYGYLPDDRDIDVYDASLRKSDLTGVSLLDFSKGSAFRNFDIGHVGLDIKNFDSFKDRLCYMILNEDMEKFMLGCSIRFDDITVYENFIEESVETSNGEEENLRELCKAFPKRLSMARNEYRDALTENGESSQKLSDAKKKLEDTYSDLKKTAEKVLDIIDRDCEPEELRSEKYFKNSQTLLSSNGDLKLTAQNDLEITAKNITLNATGNINLRSDGAINQLSEKKIEMNTGNASFALTPDKVEATVKQIWLADLPYDTDLTLNSRGFSVTAVKSDITTLTSASMSDGFGGEFIATKGGIKIYGGSIALETPDRRSLISGWMSLASDVVSMLEQITALTDSKAGNIAVTAVQSLASDAAKIYEARRKWLELEDGRDKHAVDTLSYVCGCINNASTIVEALYELTESIVLSAMDSDSDAYKRYVQRNRANHYISPKDWVKNSFFYLKNIASFTNAMAANIASFKKNTDSALKVTATKIAAETTEFKITSETALLNNSPIASQAANVPGGANGNNNDGAPNNNVQNNGQANDNAQNNGQANDNAQNNGQANDNAQNNGQANDNAQNNEHGNNENEDEFGAQSQNRDEAQEINQSQDSGQSQSSESSKESEHSQEKQSSKESEHSQEKQSSKESEHSQEKQSSQKRESNLDHHESNNGSIRESRQEAEHKKFVKEENFKMPSWLKDGFPGTKS